MIKNQGFFSFYKTNLGEITQGDSLEVLSMREADSVNLIMTSPPFGLVRKKEYGNVHADDYCDWFKPFAKQFYRILKDNGSLVIDIGGAWKLLGCKCTLSSATVSTFSYEEYSMSLDMYSCLACHIFSH